MKTHLTTLLTFMLALTAQVTTAQRQKPVKVRVMTFNIRQENKDDGINNWELRYQQTGKFLSKSKADIIGLQEVKQIQLDDIKNTLPTYKNVGAAQDDGKQAGEYCPIFYNTEKFNLVRDGTLWLSETPETPSKSWGATCNRIATWAILQDKKTFKSIVAVNTQLDNTSDLARQNSAVLIKEQIGRRINDLPVVLTGDLNVCDDDPTYTKIATRIFPLKDAWKSVSSPKGPAFTYNGFGKTEKNDALNKIDYIFVSPKIQVRKSSVIDTSLGGGCFLSDHNAHTADIVF